MKKKLLIIALVICLATSAVYNKPLQVKAAASSAAVTSYVAEKVFLALLALAGVAVKSSDIEFIWDEGGLNVDALINNMMAYSRDLGMGMRNVLSLGAAGATTLMLQRNIWNLFKGWARDKYGTDTTVQTQVSTINTPIKAIPAYNNIQPTFIVQHNNADFIGWEDIKLNQDVIVFVYEQAYNSIHPWYIQYIFVPVQKVTNYNDLTMNIQSAGQYIGYGSGDIHLSEDLGYAKYRAYGEGYDYIFTSYNTNYKVFDLGVYNSTTMQTLNNLVTEYRASGQLDIETDINASPLIGLDDEAATTAGQDVVSYDTTATQEGQDVILEGPLAVALPEAATLEVLLKQLADEDITYEDYVRALGLAAVKTKDNTVEDVQEKEQTITINPIAGTYTVSLDSLFPFCIPFDLFDILSAFNAEPVAPEVTISLPVGYNGQAFTWQDYTISLSAFDTVAQVARIFEYIIFCIGLMLLTRKLIEG